jgi:anti-anti-sigma regulatory factor
MLKIESIADNPRSITYTVAGDLDTEHLPVLKKIVNQARKSHRSVVLDLHEVTFVDRESLHYLAGARGPGLRITHCPAYVRRWITLESGPSRRSGGAKQ